MRTGVKATDAPIVAKISICVTLCSLKSTYENYTCSNSVPVRKTDQMNNFEKI